MNSYQSRIVALCTVLSDSVWLYSIFAVVGVIVSLERSPLLFVACFFAYASSMYLSKSINFLDFRFSVAVTLHILFGMVVCYLLIGFSNIPEGENFSTLWILETEQWVYANGEVGLSLVLATLMSTLMWIRGSLTGSNDFPLEALFSIFRIGIIVMAFTVTIDIFHPADLSMTVLMYVFFASSLSGLAIGRIKPSGSGDILIAGWFKIVSALVVTVVLIGVTFASLTRDLLGYISLPITTLITWMVMVIVYLVAIPIVYAMQFIINVFRWLVGDDYLPDRSYDKLQPVEGLGNFVREFASEPVSDESSVVMQYFEYVAILIFVAILLFIVGFTFRKINGPKKISEAGIKSEIEGSENSINDLFDIAKRLLRRDNSNKTRDFVIPDHLDSKSKFALNSYYQLLHLSSKNGVDKSPFATADEFRPFLYRLFDVVAVKQITTVFVRVCYGRHIPSIREVEELTQLIEDLSVEKIK